MSSSVIEADRPVWLAHTAGPVDAEGFQRCSRCKKALTARNSYFTWGEGSTVYEHEDENGHLERYWQAPPDAKVEPCQGT